MSERCPCERTEVKLPEYPYDPFLVVLLPSGSGELYRQVSPGQAIARFSRVWEGWRVDLLTSAGTQRATSPGLEDAVRAAVDLAHSAGRLYLTRVDPEGSES